MDESRLDDRIRRLSPERRALLEQWRDAKHAEYPDASPQAGPVAALAEIWRQVLGIPEVRADDNFFELGGDSIQGFEIVTAARRIGVPLTPRLFFRHQTINEMLQGLSDGGPAVRVGEVGDQREMAAPSNQSEVPLTPIQAWFFGQNLTDSASWHQVVLFELGRELDPHLLRRALVEVVENHPALRARFSQAPDERWVQRIDTDARYAVPHTEAFEVADLTDGELDRVCGVLQDGLDLATGRLLSAAVVNIRDEGTLALLLMIHHLAVDGVSIRIIAEDIEAAYMALEGGRAVTLECEGCALAACAQAVRDITIDRDADEVVQRWHDLVARVPQIPSIGSSKGLVADTVVSSLTIDGTTTNVLLRGLPDRISVTLEDALLCGLTLSLESHTGRRLAVDLESHGRDSIEDAVDCSRTVGWFTSISPIVIDLSRSHDVATQLANVHEVVQTTRRLGQEFGAFRFLHPDAAVRGSLASLPEREISFNYLGRFSRSKDKIIREPLVLPAVLQRRSEARPYTLEFGAAVIRGQLTIQVVYVPRSRHDSRASEILGFMKEYLGVIAKGLGSSVPAL